jgi:spermidine/putrescine transport system ATP-binding protein
VKVCIRPERVDLEPAGTTGPNRVPGMVERVVYVGSVLHVLVNLAPGERIQVFMQNEGDALPWSQGTPITASMPAEALRVLPHGEVSAEGFAAAARTGVVAAELPSD